jgi:hypothetical protein
VKRAGYRLHFRLGADAVRTRMYRSFAQLAEGWSKNLALLFPAPRVLALKRAAEFAAIVGGTAVALGAATAKRPPLAAVAGTIAVGTFALFQGRVRRAGFSRSENVLATFGLPLFAYLLLRSADAHASGRVPWKGRTYGQTPHELSPATFAVTSPSVAAGMVPR